MLTKRFCLTLDLKNDPDLIAEYRHHHKKVWPEVYNSIKKSGILDMEIYLYGNRLFMIMETTERFSFEHKKILDAGNQKVKDWEELMWKYQQPLPDSKPGEKWELMSKNPPSEKVALICPHRGL